MRTLDRRMLLRLRPYMLAAALLGTELAVAQLLGPSLGGTAQFLLLIATYALIGYWCGFKASMFAVLLLVPAFVSLSGMNGGRPNPFEPQLWIGMSIVGSVAAIASGAGAWRSRAGDALARVTALAEDNERLYRAELEARLHAERAAAAAAEQHARLDHLKDEFLSLAAHELKTPLTVVKGNSQLLLRMLARGTGTPEEHARHLELIERRARYMELLVNELLDLSRIASGRLEFHPEPVDVGALVRAVVAQQRDMHPATPFAVELPEGAVVGEWDAGRLEQALTNLLDNAVKFSPAGSPVRVQLAPGEGEATLTVSDRGIGIPAGDLPHIFERHYRARNLQRGHSGLGLGLYLAAEIVTRHGGRITVESVEGDGASFHVTLPLAAPTAEPALRFGWGQGSG